MLFLAGVDIYITQFDDVAKDRILGSKDTSIRLDWKQNPI